jgi:hypothetical protein
VSPRIVRFGYNRAGTETQNLEKLKVRIKKADFRLKEHNVKKTKNYLKKKK